MLKEDKHVVGSSCGNKLKCEDETMGYINNEG